MKTTRRSIFGALLAAPLAAVVSKWNTPKPELTPEPPLEAPFPETWTFEWTKEIRPIHNKNGAYLGDMHYFGWSEARPTNFREKILKLYPNRPSDLMRILKELEK